MNLENERKAFEEYYIANHHDGDIHPNQQLLEWSENGEFYFATSVNDLWDMWLASANREGYKLVPLKPKFETMQEMNVAIIENISETPKYRMQQVYKAMIGACDE